MSQEDGEKWARSLDSPLRGRTGTTDELEADESDQLRNL
jgi:hypothetical protein